ncbi:SDR family NAD(P)-dependent oxidoreductase [Massilia endophytica]|uniref:SDR family NAD(P)-dependent oxidoreductase n=1 Tax=Massilia endophytica TaxID=2899220 RepID=UPI001E562D6C|nr:SDR family NAD(P)-dependent oxidoreductase [Massilia endophytica]UGQ47620.1 SDR family oxidoreductase [Massilia endophytica]
MASLDGKHALVTGGGRGIGAACAKALLAQGARVTIAGRDRAGLERTAESLRAASAPDRVAIVAVDVSDEAAVHEAFREAALLSGAIDILVNNAGQALSAPFMKTSAAHWRQMLDVNLTGAFHCTQAALPGMLEAGWGRIVNVASTAGMTGYRYVSAYVAAKHGVVGLTRALALEVAAKGVTVNAVCPGFTETDMVQQAVAAIMQKTGRSEDEARAELAAGNPQRRLVQAEEVANAVAWLCLPESAAMNGQAIAVAGGEVM